MKITRRELKQIIERTLVNEGFFSAIKKFVDPTSGPGVLDASDIELSAMSTQDSIDLFKAMKGMGTDEPVIQGIMTKRAADLHVLYEEYQNLMRGLVQFRSGATQGTGKQAMAQAADMVLPGFASGVQNVHSMIENQDLISWLEEDGMKNEAQMVAAALAQAGKQRSKPVA